MHYFYSIFSLNPNNSTANGSNFSTEVPPEKILENICCALPTLFETRIKYNGIIV